MLDLWQGIFRVMMRMTEFVMQLAPDRRLRADRAVVAKAGFDAAGPLLVFGACVVAGLAIYALIALPLLIRFVGARQSLAAVSRDEPGAPDRVLDRLIGRHAAALPRVRREARARLGAHHELRAAARRRRSITRAARSTNAPAAMFIAQAYGLHLSFGVQFTVVILALITSMGIASIPAASLVGIAIILTAVGLPAEAIGVLFVLDRLLDMARTAVNVFADATCAVIVARLEGEEDVLR